MTRLSGTYAPSQKEIMQNRNLREASLRIVAASPPVAFSVGQSFVAGRTPSPGLEILQVTKGESPLLAGADSGVPLKSCCFLVSFCCCFSKCSSKVANCHNSNRGVEFVRVLYVAQKREPAQQHRCTYSAWSSLRSLYLRSVSATA